MKQLFTFLYVIIRLINDIDQTIEKGAQEILDHSTSPEGPHNHLQNIPFMDNLWLGPNKKTEMNIIIPSDDDEDNTANTTLSYGSTFFPKMNNGYQGFNSIYNNFNIPHCVTPFRQFNSSQLNYPMTPLSTTNQYTFYMNMKPKSQTISFNNNNTDNVINVLDIITKKDIRTTVMIKFIPIKYNSNDFIEEIDSVLGTNENFRTYDLVYLPISFKIEKNLGYAFINFINPIYVVDFYYKTLNLTWKKHHSNKNPVVRFAKVQGKNNLIIHLKESPGEEKKPMLFDNRKGEKEYRISVQKEYFGDVCKYWIEIISSFSFI